MRNDPFTVHTNIAKLRRAGPCQLREAGVRRRLQHSSSSNQPTAIDCHYWPLIAWSTVSSDMIKITDKEIRGCDSNLSLVQRPQGHKSGTRIIVSSYHNHHDSRRVIPDTTSLKNPKYTWNQSLTLVYGNSWRFSPLWSYSNSLQPEPCRSPRAEGGGFLPVAGLEQRLRYLPHSIRSR